LMRCARGTMATTSRNNFGLMSVPKLPVRHIDGAGAAG
jgi:hypothetical protein